MKKGSVGGRRSTRRSSAAALLETPTRVASPPPSNHSPPAPKSTLFNNSNKRTKKMTAVRASSIIGSPSPPASKPPAADANGLASIPDLKNLASSRLQDLKQHIDRSHTEILKDSDSAHSRLHKRFKIQTQACQQILDEADKEYKKMTQRTTESREAMMLLMQSSWWMHRPRLLVLAKHPSLSCHSPLRKQSMLLTFVMGFLQSSFCVSVSICSPESLGLHSWERVGDSMKRTRVIYNYQIL